MFLPFILSFVPLLFALIGTHLRFHASADVLGKLGLALSVAGCTGVVLFMLVNTLFSSLAPESGRMTWVSYAAVGCVLSIRLGYILFGLDALRNRLLPRWNELPLLVGLTVVLGLPLEWFGVPALLPTEWANPSVHFALTGACWLLLGLALMSPTRDPKPTAAT